MNHLFGFISATMPSFHFSTMRCIACEAQFRHPDADFAS
jgi:hypothetical protein